MTTSTDVANQALQLVGTRTTIASLAENSNEAVQCNLAYNYILSWALSLANWNFARRTLALTISKQIQLPLGSWTIASPSPPWMYEYALPADFIKAVYAFDVTAANGTINYTGEPVRFVIAMDVLAAVEQQVLLSNNANIGLVYTATINDPTHWPGYFNQVMVAMLAWRISYALTGDKLLEKDLDELSTRAFMIAEQINREEGLNIPDSTPEWIQAIGIPYPYRRTDKAKLMTPRGKGQNDNGS